MTEDPIMQQLRRTREALLSEAGGNVGKLLENANAKAKAIMAAVESGTSRRRRKPAAKGRGRGRGLREKV